MEITPSTKLALACCGAKLYLGMKCMCDNTNTAQQLTVYTNKGTGAGGAKTNLYGKRFEEITNNQHRLINSGYSLVSFAKKNSSKLTYDYYLVRELGDNTTVFVLQNGLKKYMREKHHIELFRCPDEAYIIEHKSGKKEIKILEKKEQNVEGSVETKLWSGPSLKREYEIVLGQHFIVHYGFCVSNFLKHKICSTDAKYTCLRQILNENNIKVLYGEDANYFETLDEWIATSSV